MKALFSAIVFLMSGASAMAQTSQPILFREVGASTSLDDYNWDRAVLVASARAQAKADLVCGQPAKQVTSYNCHRKTAYVFFVYCSADFTCEN